MVAGSVPATMRGPPSYSDSCVEPGSVKGTFWAAVTPASGPPHATATTSRSSQAERQAVRKDRGKTSFADPALRLFKSIGRTMEGHSAHRKVDDRVRGPWIAVSRLADASGVQKRAGRERVRDVVPHPAGLRAPVRAKERGNVGVAGAAVRCPGKRERGGGTPRVGDVLPQGIAEASMAERHIARFEGPRERRQHVPLRRGEPALMHLRGDRRGRIEEGEVLPPRDRAVVV